MKRRFIFCLTLCLTLFCGISLKAQNLKTISQEKAYGDLLGFVPGKETYTYFVNNEGKNVLHGNYSFVGSKSLSNNTTQANVKYSIKASYKNGYLNGAYSVTGVYTGKNYSYTRGWIPYTSNSKMTGTFLNGKPQGNFVASYPGEHYTSEANVTMKNGKYVNSYYYSGSDGNKWHSYKGLLTADGKLTGKWTIEADASPTVTLEFVNNICVSRSEKNFSTPPHVTAKARQYAEGKISKEKILESGLVIKRKSIALNDVLYLLNYNEFSLERIPGDYSMEDYDHEQYYEEVIQLPTFSDAEYEEFLKARENGKAFDFGNRTCNTSSIKLDKEYGLYNVYGWDYDQEAQIYIYFTDKQTKQFQEPLMANPIKFSELIKDDAALAYETGGREELKKYIMKYGVGIWNYQEYYWYPELYYNADSTLISRDGFTWAVNNDKLIQEGLREQKEIMKEVLEMKQNCQLQDMTIRSLIYNVPLETENFCRVIAEQDNCQRFKCYKDIMYSLNVNVSIQSCLDDFEREINRIDSFQREYIAMLENEKWLAQTKTATINYLDKKTAKLYNSLLYDVMHENFSNYDEFRQHCKNLEYLKFLSESYSSWNDAITQIKSNDARIAEMSGKDFASINKAYIACEKGFSLIPSYKNLSESEQQMASLSELAAIQQQCMAFLEIRAKVKIDGEKIAQKTGKEYADVLKAYTNIEANYQLCPAISTSTQLSKDVDALKMLGALQQDFLSFIDLRVKIDEEYAAINAAAGKEYADVAKAFKGEYAGFDLSASFTNHDEYNQRVTDLNKILSIEKECLSFIDYRKQIATIHSEITNAIKKQKNTSKAYKLLFGALNQNWDVQCKEGCCTSIIEVLNTLNDFNTKAKNGEKEENFKGVKTAEEVLSILAN